MSPHLRVGYAEFGLLFKCGVLFEVCGLCFRSKKTVFLKKM